MSIMKRKPEIIACLEIASSQIRAITGRIDVDGKVDVISLAEEAILSNSSLMDNGEHGLTPLIKRVIKKASDVAGQSIQEIYLSVPTAITKIVHQRIVLDPDSVRRMMNVDKIKAFVKGLYNQGVLIEAEQVLKVYTQAFIIEEKVEQENSLDETAYIDLHILVAEKAKLQFLKNLVQAAHLKIIGFIPEVEAVSGSVLTDENIKMGVALVDLGATNTTVSIFSNGILQKQAVINLGGENITKDIQKLYNLNLGIAENIKVKYGNALDRMHLADRRIAGHFNRHGQNVLISVKDLASVIRARMEEIIFFVQEKIKQLGMVEELADGIVFVGGGSLLPNLEVLARMFLETNGAITIGSPIHILSHNHLFDLDKPTYATSIGLILKGAELEEETWSVVLANNDK